MRRAARGVALSSIVVASACGAGGPPASRVNPYATAVIPSAASPPPAEAATAGAVATAEEGVSDRAPVFGAARLPMPVAPLEDRGKDAWPKKALPAGRSLGRGGVVPPGFYGPERIAIATADKKGAFVDARSGKVLAQLPAEPEYVAPRAGAVTLAGRPPRLLRVSDAKVVTPKMLGVDKNESLKTTLLAATPREEHVLALAETSLGAKLAGIANADLTSFQLYETPFGGMAKSFAATLNAREWQVTATYGGTSFGDTFGTPFVLPHEAPCLRARVDKDGKTTCLEHAPSVGAESGVRWLEGDFYSFGGAVGHVEWGKNLLSVAPPVPGTKTPPPMCFRRGARSSLPRVVVTCQANREAFMWSPGKILAFQGPADSNDLGGLIGADIGYVLPMPDAARASGGDRDRPTSRWLDVEGERIVTSPAMVPLAIAAFAGMEPIALASSQDANTTTVWAIEFGRLARDRVASITDCPGTLGELREEHAHGRKRYLVLACMTPPPKHTVAQSLIWAEILDTEKKVRWRTTLMPELFFDNGLVVLSTRRAMSAESKTAPGELTSVDLTSLP